MHTGCSSQNAETYISFSSELKLVAGKKFSLIGTPQGDEIKDPSRKYDIRVSSAKAGESSHIFTEIEFLPDVVNDLDVDFSADPKAAAAYANDQRNLRKIREHTAKLKVDIIFPLRPGKRLLVLDIDYSNSRQASFCVQGTETAGFRSYSGHETAHLRRTSSTRMCSAEAA